MPFSLGSKILGVINVSQLGSVTREPVSNNCEVIGAAELCEVMIWVKRKPYKKGL